MGGLLLAVSLLVGSLAPPVAAQAPRPASDGVGIGIRLVDAPVSRRDDYRAHRYIIDHVKPDQKVRRRIAVTNESDTRHRVQLYPAAAAAQDGFTFAPGRTGNELTSWVKLERSELVLAPDETATVWTEISVANDATGGEHYGVIWAEINPKRDLSQQVHHVGRAGVRIYLSVGPGGEPRSDFRIEDLSGAREANGVPVVTARVKNTGGRALDLTGKLTLSDGPGGVSAGPFNVKAGTIGPGHSTWAKTTLNPRLPDGAWTARLTLTSGLVKRETSGRITIDTPQRASQQGGNTSVAALTAVSLVAVVATALLAVYGYRCRNRLR